MIVDLRTIPEGSRRFQFVLERNWWPSDAQRDESVRIGSPVQVNMEIYKAGDKYVLDGELRGGLQLVCDRCLESFHRELRTAFRVYLALPLKEEDDAEIELAEKDLEVDFIRGEEIELDEIIREQIYLSLPMKSLCSGKCLGLCPTCGTNLNEGSCQCHRDQGHPAFLDLEKLNIEGD
jgi:uncharacterized protein